MRPQSLSRDIIFKRLVYNSDSQSVFRGTYMLQGKNAKVPLRVHFLVLFNLENEVHTRFLCELRQLLMNKYHYEL